MLRLRPASRREKGGNPVRPLPVTATQELELRRRGHVARRVILRRHHRAIFAHLVFVSHVLLREAEGLIIQQERSDSVGG